MGTSDDTVTSPDEDSVEFQSNGRIKFMMGGMRYILRPPRLGEFMEFRQQIVDFEQYTTGKTPTDITADEQEMQFKAMIEFQRSVFATLSDRALPDESKEWAAWLLSPSMHLRQIRHWRDIPLVPGNDELA